MVLMHQVRIQLIHATLAITAILQWIAQYAEYVCIGVIAIAVLSFLLAKKSKRQQLRVRKEGHTPKKQTKSKKKKQGQVSGKQYL